MSKYLNLVLKYTYIGVNGEREVIAVIGGGEGDVTFAEARAEMGKPEATDEQVIEWATVEAIGVAAKAKNVAAVSYYTGRTIYIPPAIYERCVISCGEPTDEDKGWRKSNGLKV